jgi:adenylate kinase
MGNVCFLFGINGVGKSTLAREIATQHPGTTVISSSELLRTAFGGVTRECLEQADPLAKQAALHGALAEAFHRHAAAPLVICDMHLTVQLGAADRWHYEHMWSPSLAPFAAAFFCVTAPMAQVIARRSADLANGRKRSLCPRAAIEHDHVEREDFRRYFRHEATARVVNNSRPVDVVAAEILGQLVSR